MLQFYIVYGSVEFMQSLPVRTLLVFMHFRARSHLTGKETVFVSVCFFQNAAEELLQRRRRCYFVLAIH